MNGAAYIASVVYAFMAVFSLAWGLHDFAFLTGGLAITLVILAKLRERLAP